MNSLCVRRLLWIVLGVGVLLSLPAFANGCQQDGASYAAEDHAISVDLSDSGRGRLYNERMAAWQMTLVATDEKTPNTCIDTYVNDRIAFTQTYQLAKLVVGLEVDGETVFPSAATNIRVEGVPGGVVADFVLHGVHITTEIYPLLRGRDSLAWEGAALYRVAADPPSQLVVKCGGGHIHEMFQREICLRQDKVGAEGDAATVVEETGRIRSAQHPLAVAVTSSGPLMVRNGDEGGGILVSRLAEGQGQLVVGFSGQPKRAAELAHVDVQVARAEIKSYYEQLARCRIETPESVINDAFQSALLNLEYTWVAPFGWQECLQKWVAMWHMQASGAATWLGQADRVRSCILSHGENLFPDGAVPQLSPSGMTHRDFGGSNQYFAWQLREYWDFTADREVAEKMGPVLDRVIQQTWQQYDPDGNGLLSWGQQIGNQEDYISTPYDGASPSMEGISMLRTRAKLARAVGDLKRAAECERRAADISGKLRCQLWLPDVGRFAFFRDPLGVTRPDAQYHTLIYPTLWGLVDPLDSWTAIRHLRDRLQGPAGEVYCSNNFVNHILGTWGMQAGVAQQPWAARGLAAVGLGNAAHRPLKVAAQWAMNADHRGSWPEMATESNAAYFSPPAGLFLQAVIETVFGLRLDRPAAQLTISPSFPDHWPRATLNLPEFSVAYSKQGNHLTYVVSTREAIARRIRWLLPPCRISEVRLNGRLAHYELDPAVRCVLLSVNTPASNESRLEIAFEPLDYRVEHPGSIAEGERFDVRLEGGVAIEQVVDRCGLLAEIQLNGQTHLKTTLRESLLTSALPYGRLGQLNFSRRSFFIKCRTSDGVSFWEPIDITVLPPWEVAAAGELEFAQDEGILRLRVRNNTASRLAGGSELLVWGRAIAFDVEVPPRSEQVVTIRLPRNLLGLLSPGENLARVDLPGVATLDVRFLAADCFRIIAELRQIVQSRMKAIPLPLDSLEDDARWREFRNWYAYGHPPWNRARPPLESLDPSSKTLIRGLPGVAFQTTGRRLAVASHKLSRASVSVKLHGQRYRKLYLLVIPFLDNHDTYVPVAQLNLLVSVESEVAADSIHEQANRQSRQIGRGLITRTLQSPGDLDWWCPAGIVGEFSTARQDRPDRFGLLPQLSVEQADWLVGAAPSFPQPEYYASSLAVRTPACVLNVVEVVLPRALPLESLTLQSIGADPAIGLVAIVAEGPVAIQANASPWLPDDLTGSP